MLYFGWATGNITSTTLTNHCLRGRSSEWWDKKLLQQVPTGDCPLTHAPHPAPGLEQAPLPEDGWQAVLLPQFSKPFFLFIIPPGSSIPLSLHHVYTHVSELSAILRVILKDHIKGDVKLGRRIQRKCKMLDFSSLIFSYGTAHNHSPFQASIIMHDAGNCVKINLI